MIYRHVVSDMYSVYRIGKTTIRAMSVSDGALHA